MNDYTAFAFETLAIASGNNATKFTRSVYDPAGKHLPVKEAWVTINPGPIISYVFTGLTVGTGTGHKATAYSSFVVNGFENIKNFQATSFSTGTAASISVTYLR